METNRVKRVIQPQENRNTSTINVSGISGEGNVIENVRSIEVTGLKLKQDFPSNTGTMNVYGISGEGQVVENVCSIEVTGSKLNQDFLSNNSTTNVYGISGERQVVENVGSIEVTGPKLNQDFPSNTGTMNVTGIKGDGNVIENIGSIEVTGLKLNQDFPSNTDTMNVYGINGEGQVVENVGSIEVTGLKLNQDFPSNTGTLNVTGIKGEGNVIENVDSIAVTDLKLKQDFTSNSGTMNVSGISGKRQVIENVGSIAVTDLKLNQDFPSNTDTINVAGISGEGQVVENVKIIKVSGPDLTQPLPPNSTADSGSVQKLEGIEVNGKSYEVLNKIGEGGLCHVYQVYDPIKKETYALKIFDLQCIEVLEEVVTSYKNEIDLLFKLRKCESVVYLYDYEYCESDKKLLMLMEKGDTNMEIVLNPFMADRNKLKQHDPLEIKFYFRTMIKAVNEIHSHHVIHADLKPENFILINGKVKLIDFGIFRDILENQTSIHKENTIVTFDYMSPEILTLRTGLNYKNKEKRKEIKYNSKIDIWSLGCILYGMVSGHTPFQYCSDKLKAISDPNYEIDYSKIENQKLLDCIKKCLQHDQTKRPTASELLQHCYLN